MSSISSVSGLSNAWSSANTQRSQMQAKMFAKTDTNGSGGIDQTELQTMLTDISKKTGTTLDSAKLFSTMDSNADGSLSSDELSQGMQSILPPPTTMDFAQNRNGSSDTTQADDLFSKVDSNADGSVDATEMQAFTDKMKSETGQDSPINFAQLDTDSDGKLTQTEFDAGRPTASVSGTGSVEGAGGPPPPPGGAGRAQGSHAASGASSSSTTFDPLDTNQDGSVSEIERLAGALKDLIDASSSTDSSSGSTNSANDTIVKLAKLIYQQIANGTSSTNSNTLSATA